MKLKDLKKGDIYQDGKNRWDGWFRFHSCEVVDDRLFICLMGMNYSGDINKCNPNSFTWRDIEREVYIPVLYKCEHRKTKGIPCVPVSAHRCLYPSNLNPINVSDKYCDRNDYWYDNADLLF